MSIFDGLHVKELNKSGEPYVMTNISVPENWIRIEGSTDKHGHPRVHSVRKAHVTEVIQYETTGDSGDGKSCVGALITQSGQVIPLRTTEQLQIAEKAMGIPALKKPEAKPIEVVVPAGPSRPEQLLKLKQEQEENARKIKELTQTTSAADAAKLSSQGATIIQ